MTSEFEKTVTSALEECRAEALAKFIAKLMDILEKQGYSFSDLLDALSCWAYTKSDYREVVQFLEKAGDKAH
ncbi:hypothetical protein I8748_32195 [Nostoc sp. CENA67]|uniref:Uncharacterized protein n=1 Tax=Amazonocrinis nigriterrae CENA67 TaxID=2794033 RepID=A0A8J7LCR6_9NOST|nr:hypothetical protein [Amazonocrinis nigriterrae]MBH8566761.1 hypothetical protein [Amazonocrinis nigriterrae CENA67]